ncbi:MAG: ABC transporter substrate-binding protein [Deltaproteobacteria bacterium]|nr:ABC transporter substrate-binding protein [Deltaproteobacteria bacterium]
MSDKISLLIWPLALIIFGLFLGCGDNKNLTTSQSAPAVTEVKSQTSQPSGTSSPEPKITVLRAPFPNEPTSPSNLLLVKELGFLKKHNLDFEFVGAIPSAQYVAALIGEKIDFGPGSHINRTIAGISAGAKIKAVVANTETTKQIPHMVALVTKTSQVRKPADLLGKRIGTPNIGGCSEYTPYAWLSKHGVENSRSKVEMKFLPEKNLEQILRQGEIDVAMMHKVPEDVIKKGEFDIIFSDYEVWENDGGATPPYFTLQYIKERPDVVRNFVEAWVEVVNWSNANMQEAINITARLTNQDPTKLKRSNYSHNGLLKPIHAQVWIDLLIEYGEISPGITVEQVFTNEFNPFYKPKI